jgi:hypothetical protein
MMPSPDALAERKMLGLEEDQDRPGKSPRGSNGINSEQDDISQDRKAILEISKMADRMTSLLQESRNQTVEADERLRKVEEDLKLLALEK